MRKIVSFILVLTILISTSSIFSVNAESNESAQTQSTVSVAGDGGIASMLSNAISESQQVEGDVANSITALTIDGKTATVEINNDRKVKIIVGIYDEETNLMLASGMIEADEHSESVTIEIDADIIPEYFIAKAFILDEDNKPLSASFETIEYTAEHQEFLKKTVQDFEGLEVLNLDDSDDNNFAVFQDDVIKVNGTQTSNILVSVNETTKTYEFSNADETMMGLKSGDKLYYIRDDGDYSIILVSEVAEDGDVLTITGDQQVAFDDVFEYVKIDATADSYASVVQESETASTYSKKQIAPVGWDVEILDEEDGYSHEFKFDEQLNKYCKLTGYMLFEVTASIKAYLYNDHLEATIKLDQKAEFNVTMSGEVEKDINLGNIDIPIVAGVSVGMDIVLKLKAEGYISYTVTETCTIGFTLDTRESAPVNISKPPKIDSTYEIEANIYVGLALTPNVALFDDVFKVGITGELGINFNVTNQYEVNESQKKHMCEICLAGKVTAKLSVDLNLHVDLKISDDYKWNKNLYKKDNIKLFDFYVSEEGRGIGACPNFVYKITLQVVDENKKPIKGVKVGDLKTNSKGQVSDFYKEGRMNVELTKEGYQTKIFDFPVTKSCVFTITLESDDELLGDIVQENRIVDSGILNTNTNISWVLYSNGTLVVSGEGDMNFLYTKSPWSGRVDIKKVVIEKGITSVGKKAFYGCTSITSITLPEGITSIGDSAFGYCNSLESINIPNGITNIGVSAFYNCFNLTEIQIPNGVVSISNNAFMYCYNLSTIFIPESINYIGSYAFYSCASLTWVHYAGSQSQWNKINIGSENSCLTKAANIYYNSSKQINACELSFSDKGGVASLGVWSESLVTVGENTDMANEYEKRVSMQDLVPNTPYVLMVLRGDSSYYSLDTESLMYIADVTANEEGEADFTYYCDDSEDYVAVVFGDCNHNPGDWVTVVEASELELGLKVQLCTKCNEALSYEEIPIVRYEIGDVDGDGNIAIMDATLIQKYIALLDAISDGAMIRADVNGDGVVSIMDATLIQMYIAQLIPSL